MKKAFIYILAAAALFAACTPDQFGTQLGVPSDHNAIVLTPVVAGADTKAATEAGDDTYNENLISGYYWFVYSDAAGTDLVLSGYESGNDSKEILLDTVFPTGGSGSVYVVANLPVKPESPAAGDEWFEYVEAAEGVTAGINHVVQGGTTTKYDGTFASLKTLSFGKGTPTAYTKSSEFYEYTSATTGVPKPEKFVMRTEAPVAFTLQERTVIPVTAELKRVAAKIILDLHIAEEVMQTHTNTAGEEEYTKTWLADISHIQIYMLWGSTRGNLAGDKAVYSAEHSAWFYSASPRYAMYTNPVGGSYDAATNSVAGSVPDSLYESVELNVQSSVWEIVYQVNEDTDGNPIWIWGADVAEEDRTPENEGDKAFGDWDYVLVNGEKVPVLNADGTVQRKLGTKTEKKPYYAISSLPLYSMPISWSVNDAHAPFIKIILPWQGCIRANNGTGDIVSYDEKPAGTRKTTEFYYKIMIPELSALDANGCYHISLDLAVLGSEADEVPVELTGNYHVVDWNAPVAMGGDQSAGRYLNCGTSFEFFSQDEMSIPVSSSHDIEIVGTPTATYNDYSQTTALTGNLTYSTSSSTGNNFTVTTVGTSKVTVKHTLVKVLDDMDSRDVSPITYTVTIQHKGDGGSAYRKTITIVQYPSLYISSRTNSNWTTTGNQYNSNYGYVYINNAQSQSYDTTGGWNSQGTSVENSTYNWYRVVGITSRTGSNANPNTYLITTTVLDPSLGFVLGDPREDSINNLVESNSTKFASATALYGTTPRRLAYYYPSDETSRTENMVAPSFRIASSYGKVGYAIYRNDARLRCAAYQEDGYPAGRWRLPTKAELQYIATLSAAGLIPKLFNDEADGNDSIYMSAHGLISINTNNSPIVYENTQYSYGFARCVYDEWYWGSETVNRSTFTWGDKAR